MSTERFNLLSFSGKMKILHMSWMVFFVTFVVWFNHAPMLQAIGKSLSLSSDELKTLLTLNVALAIPARILVGMLVIGLIANLLVRPVADKHFMSDAELAIEKKLAHERAAAAEVGSGPGAGAATPTALVLLAWAAVGIPLAWGVYKTLLSAAKFFH